MGGPQGRAFAPPALCPSWGRGWAPWTTSSLVTLHGLQVLPFSSPPSRRLVDPAIHQACSPANGDEELEDYVINLLESGRAAWYQHVPGCCHHKYFKRYAEGEESPDNPVQLAWD